MSDRVRPHDVWKAGKCAASEVKESAKQGVKSEMAEEQEQDPGPEVDPEGLKKLPYVNMGASQDSQKSKGAWKSHPLKPRLVAPTANTISHPPASVPASPLTAPLTEPGRLLPEPRRDLLPWWHPGPNGTFHLSGRRTALSPHGVPPLGRAA